MSANVREIQIKIKEICFSCASQCIFKILNSFWYSHILAPCSYIINHATMNCNCAWINWIAFKKKTKNGISCNPMCFDILEFVTSKMRVKKRVDLRIAEWKELAVAVFET